MRCGSGGATCDGPFGCPAARARAKSTCAVEGPYWSEEMIGPASPEQDTCCRGGMTQSESKPPCSGPGLTGCARQSAPHPRRPGPRVQDPYRPPAVPPVPTMCMCGQEVQKGLEVHRMGQGLISACLLTIQPSESPSLRESHSEGCHGAAPALADGSVGAARLPAPPGRPDPRVRGGLMPCPVAVCPTAHGYHHWHAYLCACGHGRCRGYEGYEPSFCRPHASS